MILCTWKVADELRAVLVAYGSVGWFLGGVSCRLGVLVFGALGRRLRGCGLRGAGSPDSPGCPGTRPLRRDLEPVQTVSALLASVDWLGA